MLNRLKFARRELLGLPLPENGKRVTYYDTDTPKLALRVTAAGSKTFYVVKRAGGRNRLVEAWRFP